MQIEKSITTPKKVGGTALLPFENPVTSDTECSDGRERTRWIGFVLTLP